MTLIEWVTIILSVLALGISGLDFVYVKRKFESTSIPKMQIRFWLTDAIIGTTRKNYFRLNLTNLSSTICIEDVEARISVATPVRMRWFGRMNWIPYHPEKELFHIDRLDPLKTQECTLNLWHTGIEDFLSSNMPGAFDGGAELPVNKESPVRLLTMQPIQIALKTTYRPGMVGLGLQTVSKQYKLTSAYYDRPDKWMTNYGIQEIH